MISPTLTSQPQGTRLTDLEKTRSPFAAFKMLSGSLSSALGGRMMFSILHSFSTPKMLGKLSAKLALSRPVHSDKLMWQRLLLLTTSSTSGFSLNVSIIQREL
eukprot:CAMPEP_0115205982 /NCGR_PEP_ID=MMETSP0270-20121206/19968_1 /TAXON_ID=71861 /ORGANISM="Scrippsiella trochoidea, Strain CCMP3099" /LENGTH=102 /DNA_ID=CAMNT_0002619535 /DNA_START=93 /DNA_END=401 /DNA_ORIENTATION=-